jgi:hypothetical protein
MGVSIIKCKRENTTFRISTTFTEFRLEIVVRDTPSAKRKAHPLPTGPAARPHSLPTGPARPHMDDTNMLDILDKEITDIVLQHGQVPKDPSVLDLYSSKLRQRVKMQQRLIQSQKKIMKAHNQRDNTPPLHSGQAAIVCDVPQDTAAKLPRNSYDWVTTLGALRVHNIADAVMHTNNSGDHSKENSGDHSKAPDNLRELLLKIDNTIKKHTEEIAAKKKRKKKLETDRRLRSRLAVERAGASKQTSTEESVLHAQVTPSCSSGRSSPPHDPPHTSHKPPPTALPAPHQHKCWWSCKRACPWGGPGPEKWCKNCEHYSWHYPCLAVLGGACQRCICLSKAAARETEFKHSLGGTCCAYLDGTACEC